MRDCEIGFCPVDSVWSSWTAWAPCSATCGDSGVRTRDRAYIPGRNGAARTEPKVGSATEKEACNRKKCPVPAKWTWSEWSRCDIECYKPDGYRGFRERKHLCEEGNPKHPFVNCDNEPGGDKLDRPCPGLKECSPLTRIKARVALEAGAGTNCDVKFTLRNRGTSESCQTGILDGPGDNWEQDQVEDFWAQDFNKEFWPCRYFYPKPGKLQFQMSCSDSGKLAKVELWFGSTRYYSQGLGELQWHQWTNSWHDLV